jgi:3-isopropylmalate/(R)-2-methylmalate dehydratase small subunit
MRGAQILLAGDNFGCGSSREHAPWALVGFGFRAIVSTSFADIFQNNALKNGLLPVSIPVDVHQALVDHFSRDAHAELEIDLLSETIGMPDGTSAAFRIDSFARRCLLDGVDELGYLLNLTNRITDYEQNTAFRPC